MNEMSPQSLFYKRCVNADSLARQEDIFYNSFEVFDDDYATGPNNTSQQVHSCSSFQIYSTVSVIFCCCIFQLQICFSDHFKIRLSRRRKHPGSRQRCKQWKGTWINSSHLLLYQQRVFVRSVYGGTRSFEEPGLAESEILRL